MDKLKRIIKKTLDDDKAQDIVAIPLKGKSSLADFMIVATGTSQRHISSIADHLESKLRMSGHPRIATEGRNSEGWVVVDAGDIIVHLFKPENRRLYNLEKMWGLEALSSASHAEHAP